MTHDRVGSDTFSLSHELLATMLGVRCAGVTVAAGALQRAGLITALDREGLEVAPCECYATSLDELERILQS